MKSTSTLWILAVALAVSLAGDGWLMLKADRLYRDTQALRLDPLELGALHSGQAAQAGLVAQRPIFVFFGDSRAAQWPVPASVSQYDFRNLGIGGQTSAQVAARFDVQVLPLRPRVMLLQVGINDIKAIALFPQQRDEIVARCKAHIDAIVAQSRRAGIDVVLTTVFPVGHAPLWRRRYWSQDAAAGLDEVNRHIRSLAAPGVTVLDSDALLRGTSTTVRDELAADFLHLSAPGYATLNAALTEMLGRR